MVPRYNIPSRWASFGAPRQEGPSVPSRGLDISPLTRTVETVGLASEGAQLIDSGLSTEVVETILHSRAPSMRKLYALKWNVFTSWCSDHQLDPVNCPVGTVLEFRQDQFTAGLAPSVLKVFVVAISAYHIPLGGMSLGKDPLVSRLLRGTLRLRCCKPSVLLLSECGPGKAQFSLLSAGIRWLRPQSYPGALPWTLPQVPKCRHSSLWWCCINIPQASKNCDATEFPWNGTFRYDCNLGSLKRERTLCPQPYLLCACRRLAQTLS